MRRPATHAVDPGSYLEFANLSPSWKFLERPAFDAQLADVLRPETKVLDVGSGTGRIIEYFIEHGVSLGNIVGIEP